MLWILLLAIVLTTRQIYRVRVGRVADFCPICRRFEAAALIDVRVARLFSRLFGVSKRVEHVRKCESCGTELPAHLVDYAAIDAGSDLDTEALLRRSQPDAPGRWGERLALEERALAGRASGEERRALIAEPFFALDRELQLRNCRWADGGLAWSLRLISFAVLLAGIALAVVAGSWQLGAGMGLAVVAFWVGASAAARHSRRRFVSAVLRRDLMKALKPIQPRPEELESVCTELKLDGMELALRIDARDLSPEPMHRAVQAAA